MMKFNLLYFGCVGLTTAWNTTRLGAFGLSLRVFGFIKSKFRVAHAERYQHIITPVPPQALQVSGVAAVVAPYPP